MLGLMNTLEVQEVSDSDVLDFFSGCPTFGVETVGVPDWIPVCGGDDRLSERDDLDCGEMKPGPVIISCFSTTILLASFVVSNIMSPDWFDFAENGKGTSLKINKIYKIYVYKVST